MTSGQLLLDQLHDQLVGHELASVHEPLRLDAQGRAGAYRLAQQVPGGDLGEAELSAQPLRLGALAGARRPEENDLEVHVVA